ncbi:MULTISPECIES: 50S ribosomal protein L25/general stress protein Ctc [Azospira]|jgi:large subunit ribosomal protein L25|uniref:Large ribosomal subunit protein bL25 n=2 Tax=Azospira oryzae TaxID=146939 RepID=G8QJL4_AZOOP|nr:MULTISPECIES: 50S ribosomal protein L25/general stress protein Ctc [Azospira]TLS17355.1 MAG: 50S ribosomal protein L25/general stress protein Ctc [Betaproteobacteria bacterium]AEV25439.1 ribosomal protein L25, Ctc-form [Azospira oryzae PS]MBP7489281.1 50S ribosomal protein L25/general stress protein Ctc [Azospira sp.]MDK9690966.1 50S ribosomal protein L25/general stress protein Ctc [Azospira sp.]RZT76225.1 LSU ribosomal protein L25P [Azospira oryzae]
MIFEFNADKRNDQGTGASRRLRRAGKVPGIVYGGTAAPISIEVDHNAIYLALRKEAFHSSLINLNIDGKKESVLLRDYQAHPYKAIVLHVDFQRVDPNQKLHTKVPLHFVNADIAPGVKLGGGIVSHVLNEVEVTCLAADLPEFIEVDLKDLAAGHSIHIADVKLPKGVALVQHGQDNPVVATIMTVRGAAAAEEAAPAA